MPVSKECAALLYYSLLHIVLFFGVFYTKHDSFVEHGMLISCRMCRWSR